MSPGGLLHHRRVGGRGFPAEVNLVLLLDLAPHSSSALGLRVQASQVARAELREAVVVVGAFARTRVGCAGVKLLHASPITLANNSVGGRGVHAKAFKAKVWVNGPDRVDRHGGRGSRLGVTLHHGPMSCRLVVHVALIWPQLTTVDLVGVCVRRFW